MAFGIQNLIRPVDKQVVTAPFSALDAPGGMTRYMNQPCFGRINRPLALGMSPFVIQRYILLRDEAFQSALAHRQHDGQDSSREGQIRARYANIAAVNAQAGSFRVIEPVGKDLDP